MLWIMTDEQNCELTRMFIRINVLLDHTGLNQILDLFDDVDNIEIVLNELCTITKSLEKHDGLVIKCKYCDLISYIHYYPNQGYIRFIVSNDNTTYENIMCVEISQSGIYSPSGSIKTVSYHDCKCVVNNAYTIIKSNLIILEKIITELSSRPDVVYRILRGGYIYT